MCDDVSIGMQSILQGEASYAEVDEHKNVTCSQVTKLVKDKLKRSMLRNGTASEKPEDWPKLKCRQVHCSVFDPASHEGNESSTDENHEEDWCHARGVETANFDEQSWPMMSEDRVCIALICCIEEHFYDALPRLC